MTAVNPLMARASMYACKKKHAQASEPPKAELSKSQRAMFGHSPGTQAIEEVDTEVPEPYEFDEEKHPRSDGGEFTLSGKPKKKGKAIESKKGKQQALFAKGGKAGQMNLFADKAVPDEWTPEGIKKKKSQGGLFALHAGLIADVIRYARATGGQKGMAGIKSDVPRQGQFKWITIGGDKGAPAGHKGGSPVLINVAEGKIVGGPKALEGRTLKSLDKNVSGTEKDKRKDQPPPERPPKGTGEEIHRPSLLTDIGMQLQTGRANLETEQEVMRTLGADSMSEVARKLKEGSDEQLKRVHEIVMKDKQAQADRAAAESPPETKPPGQSEEPKPKKKRREYSDQEIGEREHARNFNEVMGNPEDFSDNDLRRADGWADHYRRHLKRQLDRGDISADAYDTQDDSLAREQQNLRRILRDREAGALKPGPEFRNRAQKIADKAIEGNANVWTVGKDMGLTRQEIGELIPEITSEMEERRKLEAEAGAQEPSPARKKAQDAAKRKREGETPEGRPKPEPPQEQPAETPAEPQAAPAAQQAAQVGDVRKWLDERTNEHGNITDTTGAERGGDWFREEVKQLSQDELRDALFHIRTRGTRAQQRWMGPIVKGELTPETQQQVNDDFKNHYHDEIAKALRKEEPGPLPSQRETPAAEPKPEPEATPKVAEAAPDVATRSTSEISAERKKLFEDYKRGEISVDEYDDRDTELAREHQKARQAGAAQPEATPKPTVKPEPKPKPKRQRAPGDPYGRTLTSRLRNQIAQQMDTSDPKAVEGFHQGMTEIHKQMTDAVETHNDALRNLLGQFGIDTRQKLSGFQKSVRTALGKGADADGIQRAAQKVADRGPVPRALSKLDQIFDMAKRSPELTQERTAGEAEGSDDIESSLLETIRKGPRKAPRFTSDEVFERTWEMLGRHMGPAEEVQGQEEPDQGFPWEDKGEEVPFSLARVKERGAWEVFRFRVLKNIATLYRT